MSFKSEDPRDTVGGSGEPGPQPVDESRPAGRDTAEREESLEQQAAEVPPRPEHDGPMAWDGQRWEAVEPLPLEAPASPVEGLAGQEGSASPGDGSKPGAWIWDGLGADFGRFRELLVDLEIPHSIHADEGVHITIPDECDLDHEAARSEG